MKFLTSAVLLSLTVSLSASSIASSRNGYRLVYIDLSTTANPETPAKIMTYFNGELPPHTYHCPNEKRLIEIDLVYVNKRPKAITNDLVARSLQAEKESLKKLRKALRTYRDSEIDKGFDGLVVLKNAGSSYEMTTIGSVENAYERSSKVNIHQTMDIKTLNNLFCTSLSQLPYAYLD